MQHTKLLLGLLCILFLSHCTSHRTASNRLTKSSVSKNRPPVGKNGECYAKCITNDQSATRTLLLAIYTGNQAYDNVAVENREIVLKPASSAWEKKKSDRKCLSEDPNDCLVWCLVETPAVKKAYRILSDTTSSKNFEMQEVVVQTVTKKEGSTEWKQVVCQDKVTPELVSQLQQALKIKNHYPHALTGKIDAQTKSALCQFQQENRLPVGQLDVKSMELLGVDH